MSATWGPPSAEDTRQRSVEVLGTAVPMPLVPRSRPCVQCADATDAGDEFCPTCLRESWEES